MTRNTIFILLLLLLAVAAFFVLERPAPPLQGERGPRGERGPLRGEGGRRPDDGGPLPGDGGPLPGDGDMPAGGPGRQKTKRGLVLDYGHNAHLDINAIRLNVAGEGPITVDFRPHTARTVIDDARVGDPVEVTIGTRPNDEYIVYQLHRILNLRTRQEANLDALPPPPDVPPNHVAENFTLDHPQLLTDPYGGIDALRDSSLLFHFKPGLVDDIGGLIKSASRITLSAVRRDEAFGFVNINHDKVYIVLSVTIDNKTFLVR